MKFFNQSLNSLLLLAAAGTVIVGCDGRRGQMESASFRVENAKLDKTETLKWDEFGLPESKKFFFVACLTNGESYDKVGIMPFDISDGKAKQEVIADADGCLAWQEIHLVSSLQREETVRMDRTFIAKQAYTGNVTVSFAFNPWTETLIDLRKATDPDLSPEAQREAVVGFNADFKRLPRTYDAFSESAMADVKLDFNGHDVRSTEITPLLTMKPAQKFRLSVKPQFIRRNVRNQPSYLELTGGQFRVRLVVVGEDAGNALLAQDIVAYSEANLEVQAKGLAQKDIIVRIHNVAAVLSRNKFYLVLQPIGAAVGLARPAIYQGFVGPLAGNNAEVDLIPFDGDSNLFLESIGTSMTKLAELDKVTPLEMLRTVSGLRQDDESPVLNSLLTANPTEEQGPGVLKSLCAKVYKADETMTITTTQGRGIFRREVEQNVNVVTACEHNPAQFLKLERREIVESIVGKPEFRADLVSTKDIKLSRDLKYAKTQNDTQARDYKSEYGWGSSAGFDLIGLISKIPVVGPVVASVAKIFSLGFNLKASIGTNWVNSQGLAKTEDVAIASELTESEQFQVSSVGYDVNVKALPCVLLTSTYKEARGFFTCGQQSRARTSTEIYYQVNHSVTNSVFADALSANSTMWRMMVRGRGTYQVFEELMTKGNGVLMFSDLKIKDPKVDLLPAFKINQVFPGVLSSK